MNIKTLAVLEYWKQRIKKSKQNKWVTDWDKKEKREKSVVCASAYIMELKPSVILNFIFILFRV